MPRLLRPHIPLEVRCRVVLRQLGEMWPDLTIADFRHTPGGHGLLLAAKLSALAYDLGCNFSDLHLDHDPALGAREKVFRKGEHVGYRPDANDPEHLFYREKAAHRIKTNVRGLHGQHPDRVLIKRQRRRETPKKMRRPVKWPSRPLKSASRWPKRPFRKPG